MTIDIVDCPIKNGGSFHSFLLNYRRATNKPLGSLQPVDLGDWLTGFSMDEVDEPVTLW